MNPEAEKNLQVALDAARGEYEESLAGVRATYFSQLEMLHRKYARAESDALDTYHGEVRGELTDVLRKLRPLVDDEAMGAEHLKTLDTASRGSGELLVPDDISSWPAPRDVPVSTRATFKDVELAAPGKSTFFADEAMKVDGDAVVEAERPRSVFRRKVVPVAPAHTPRHYGQNR